MNSVNKKKLLIIDDDRLLCDSAAEWLSRLPLDIFLANSGKDGLSICTDKNIDIVLLDQKLPDIQGTDLYTSILSRNNQTKIIFITAYPDLKGAVRALKDGIHDYIPKPFDPDELELVVYKAINTIELERVASFNDYTYKMQTGDVSLVGRSPAMAQLRLLIERAASSQAPMFITGETGTGKNRVAKGVHYANENAGRPFITVNCTAIPENLIESELFGIEKGAFTGAVQNKKGLFELAEGGTLFLDEIGEMPMNTQAKLLNVLDEKTYKKIGGQRIIDANARIVAATNVDIAQALKDKTFRNDLYFRLNIIPIHVPPLRDRREDIPDLTLHFIHMFSRNKPVRISDPEIEKLKAYSWPGNIRELSNIIERSVILRHGSEIFPSTLIESQALTGNPESFPETVTDSSPCSLKDMEAKHIREMLGVTSGNYTQTAKILEISRSTLMRKLNEYGLK